MGLRSSRFSNAAKILVGLALALMILQFIPISKSWPGSDSIASVDSLLFSISPDRSLDSVLILICVFGFSMLVSTFNDNQHSRLISFFMVGLVVNIFIATIQLSFSERTTSEGILPYVISSGIFGNENHLSTYVFAMIPLLAFHLLWQWERPIVYSVVLALVCFFLFAVGSRAGIALSLVIGASCLILFLLNNKSVGTKYLVALGGLVLVPILFLILNGGDTLSGGLRSTLSRNTLAAIYDHGFFGTGLGTFVVVYPLYEQTSDIINKYANHAHNEYLEWLLETGVFGVLIAAGFVILLIMGIFRSVLTMLAAVSVASILFHSAFDYPLRTVAIAVLFSYLVTVILSSENNAAK